MKKTKDNFEKYKKFRDELYTFLNNQSKGLPADWYLVDHLILVMDMALTQYISIGFTDREIRDEVDRVIDSVRGRDKKKLN